MNNLINFNKHNTNSCVLFKCSLYYDNATIKNYSSTCIVNENSLDILIKNILKDRDIISTIEKAPEKDLNKDLFESLDKLLNGKDKITDYMQLQSEIELLLNSNYLMQPTDSMAALASKKALENVVSCIEMFLDEAYDDFNILPLDPIPVEDAFEMSSLERKRYNAKRYRQSIKVFSNKDVTTFFFIRFFKKNPQKLRMLAGYMLYYLCNSYRNAQYTWRTGKYLTGKVCTPVLHEMIRIFLEEILLTINNNIVKGNSLYFSNNNYNFTNIVKNSIQNNNNVDINIALIKNIEVNGLFTEEERSIEYCNSWAFKDFLSRVDNLFDFGKYRLSKELVIFYISLLLNKTGLILPQMPHKAIITVLEFIDINVLIKHMFESMLKEKLIYDDYRQIERQVIEYKLGLEVPQQIFLMSSPMVCKPLDWRLTSNGLKGGYLKTEHLDIIRFNAIVTDDSDNFNIKPNANLLECMNLLQKVPFSVNNAHLNWIKSNYEMLVSIGILSEPALAELPINTLMLKLESKVDDWRSYDQKTLKKYLYEQHGKAIREKYTIQVANLYHKHNIYFPVFLDFRGRIYRPGLLTIQGNSLSKSLLCWGNDTEVSAIDINVVNSNITYIDNVLYNFAMSYKKFYSFKEAVEWARTTIISGNFPMFSSNMEDPLLYAAYVFADKSFMIQDGHINITAYGCTIPLRRDATSSVFQITSILTRNTELAILTNVLGNGTEYSKDLYKYVLDRFYIFFEKFKTENKHLEVRFKQSNKLVFSEDTPETVLQELTKLLPELVTRGLIKKFVMPMSYGANYLTRVQKVKDAVMAYNPLLDNNKISYPLTWLIYNFVLDELKVPFKFKELLSSLARFIASTQKSISWKHDFGVIYQLYPQISVETINLFTRKKDGRSRKTVELARCNVGVNKKKNANSFPPNFIHSLDATLAYLMTKEFMVNKSCDHFGTIHDCFLATPLNAHELSPIYLNKMIELFINPIKWLNNIIIYSLDAADLGLDPEKSLKREQIMSLISKKCPLLSKQDLKKVLLDFEMFYCEYELLEKQLNKNEGFIQKLKKNPGNPLV